MALSDHWSEWTRRDCADAVALIQSQRSLLSRCLKAVSGGHYRDTAHMSAESHPVWDDVREIINQ